MELELNAWTSYSGLWVTFAVNALSIFAVWVPFRRGIALYKAAKRATRRIGSPQLDDAARGVSGMAGGGEALSITFLRVLQESVHGNAEGRHPIAFLRDAARQYTENEYAASYAQPMSMYANILPPIGFIGTTAGLMVLFVSMRLSNDTLELGGLALALSSTLFALVGYAMLEGLKIRLYRRLLLCLDDALGIPVERSAGGAVHTAEVGASVA